MNHVETIVVGIVLTLALLLLAALNRRKYPEVEPKHTPARRISNYGHTPMMAAYHDALHDHATGASNAAARPDARPKDQDPEQAAHRHH
jgi:hypothetical protein